MSNIKDHIIKDFVMDRGGLICLATYKAGH